MGEKGVLRSENRGISALAAALKDAKALAGPSISNEIQRAVEKGEINMIPIEPKSYMANERTFLEYMSMSALLFMS